MFICWIRMMSAIGTGFVPADALARLGSESDAGDEASELGRPKEELAETYIMT